MEVKITSSIDKYVVKSGKHTFFINAISGIAAIISVLNENTSKTFDRFISYRRYNYKNDEPIHMETEKILQLIKANFKV